MTPCPGKKFKSFRKLFKIKKAVAVIWILGIAAVFIVGIIYLSMTLAWNRVYSNLTSQMDASYLPTAQKIDSVWHNWPILVIMGIILWVFVNSVRQRRTDNLI